MLNILVNTFPIMLVRSHLFGYYYYIWCVNMLCSRTQHSTQEELSPLTSVSAIQVLNYQATPPPPSTINNVKCMFLSSPEPKAQRLAYIIPMLRRPSSSSTIFKHEYLRGQQADRNQILYICYHERLQKNK